MLSCIGSSFSLACSPAISSSCLSGVAIASERVRPAAASSNRDKNAAEAADPPTLPLKLISPNVSIDDLQCHQNAVAINQTITPNNNSCLYTYVLLVVDADFCALPNIHVGGVESVNGTMYVADSRKGAKQILQFDMNHEEKLV